MNQDDEQEAADIERTSAGGSAPGSDERERLKRAYGGVERVTDFHVIVEQDGKLKIVPCGGAIPFPPAIEMVYVIFTDGIEAQHYTVELEAGLLPSNKNPESLTQRVHRLRQEGSSEWDEPWAVEAAFEEQSGDWLVPTELRFEGLAKPAKLGRVVKNGIEGGRKILHDLN